MREQVTDRDPNWLSLRRLESANSGMYFSTESSTDSLPSSSSIRTAVAVMGLVIEAIQKI